jgi:hypothetical protein
VSPSPYSGKPAARWPGVTKRLVAKHPLTADEIVDVVLSCWGSIFKSRFGRHRFRIGTHIFPRPQVLGFLLQELIGLELESRHPGIWRGDEQAGEKDLVHVPDRSFSIELKTLSSPKHIYGNRSYAQKTSRGKKAKSGYYLAVNFEKFGAKGASQPSVRLIRFGWLDANDWVGQKAPTGQQAHLPVEVEAGKLLELYRKD